ncbi:uncharacterized protein MYCFIDRAFT_170646 [Pseudocercospora fijiensis CIRAD86]|uniref:Uncharacterized protein n=1 Tax=Pseudocercospora fijiensis (strain CIRAD86) TaxID=383855 RepID=N1Q8D7_PSEFD|nr:uncharacterized protein MYCFIDRAFT_170646 [Pseudocercospora fijiensis CIRAD86]EME89134.1 hypothetical protein MYCFIDRAFT_170646 [Pseudocercospora fijiensis CIRAD86]
MRFGENMSIDSKSITNYLREVQFNPQSETTKDNHSETGLRQRMAASLNYSTHLHLRPKPRTQTPKLLSIAIMPPNTHSPSFTIQITYNPDANSNSTKFPITDIYHETSLLTACEKLNDVQTSRNIFGRTMIMQWSIIDGPTGRKILMHESEAETDWYDVIAKIECEDVGEEVVREMRELERSGSWRLMGLIDEDFMIWSCSFQKVDMSAHISSKGNFAMPPATVEAMRDEPEHAVLPSSFADREPEIWAVASELDTSMFSMRLDGSSPTERAAIRTRFDAPTAGRRLPSPSIASDASQYSTSAAVSEQQLTFENERDYAPVPGHDTGRPARETHRSRSFDRRSEQHHLLGSQHREVGRSQNCAKSNLKVTCGSAVARHIDYIHLRGYSHRSAPEVEDSVPRPFSVTLIHTRPDGAAQSVKCIGLRDDIAASLKLVEDIANDPRLHGRTIQITVQGEDNGWRDPYDGCKGYEAVGPHSR